MTVFFRTEKYSHFFYLSLFCISLIFAWLICELSNYDEIWSKKDNFVRVLKNKGLKGNEKRKKVLQILVKKETIYNIYRYLPINCF